MKVTMEILTVHTCDLHSSVSGGRIWNSRSPLATQWVWGQFGLHETFSLNKEKGIFFFFWRKEFLKGDIWTARWGKLNLKESQLQAPVSCGVGVCCPWEAPWTIFFGILMALEINVEPITHLGKHSPTELHTESYLCICWLREAC